jgi:UDP-N-acetylmuramoyl-L-alanyl-D-glutamate--2,6-diaminopimelate ligase
MAQKGLAGVAAVPGRWNIVHRNPTVIIDFAHTPQALEPVLRRAREMSDGGKVIHVFGCAGERDRTKRPLMGKLSAQLADVSIVTAEDPRHESLDVIFEQIAGTHPGRFHRYDDRREAIRQAVAMAGAHDVVLLTGKGHERSMNLGGQEVPWDEVAEAQRALQAKSAG